MITVVAPDGVPEVHPGDDLAALLRAALTTAGFELADGDVVAVTSKVVSKAEGRLVDGTDRDAALPGETARVVARRGPTTIVRHRLGLTIAAAGIDRSNVEPGTMALLPRDPDASARDLRAALAHPGDGGSGVPGGVNVGVIVTDTAGRAWRTGQTDLAIGAAGLIVIDDHAGRVDRYGNPLQVTAPAVADELAGAAELAQGKLAARPFAVLRGRPDLVLPPGESGTGAGVLIRGEGEDLFGYGAREAVVQALLGTDDGLAPFGAPASVEDVRAAVRLVIGADSVIPEPGVGLVVQEALDDRRAALLATLLAAHGWELEPIGADGTRARPRLP